MTLLLAPGCGEALAPDTTEPLGSARLQGSEADPRPQRRITPLRRWVRRQPGHSPAPRSGAAFAYDPGRKVSVLFGGWGCPTPSSCTLLADTWEWDGTDWTERTNGTNPARVYADAAYDVSLGGVNVIGGSYTNTPSNASHYWDGADWIPADTVVSGLNLAARALTYEDGATPRMLSFGGDDITSGVSAFTGQRSPGGNWTYPSLVSKPSARRDAKLVWDPASDKSYLFGGRPCRMTESCAALGDYWELSASTWTDLGAGGRPSARFGFGFVYDQARSVGVLFGGRDSSAANAELWQVQFPDTWTQINTTSAPEARSYFAFAYDSSRDVGVLFGGSAGTVTPQGDTNPFGDTWELELDFDSCDSASDCDNGNCVDGTCCEAASCGECETCADPASRGVCTPVLGAEDPDSCETLCNSSGQCEGECTTDKDCPGDCNACDAGSCVLLTGDPEPGETCGAYLCGGQNVDCPAACTSDTDCINGVPCKDAECTTAGETCTDDSSCAGLTCVDGVCCREACEVCGVCSVELGATRDGDCTPAPLGAPDDACPAGCSGSDNACLESAALPAGAACSASVDCLSGSCIAGTCCAGPPTQCAKGASQPTYAEPHSFEPGSPLGCLCRAGAPVRREAPLWRLTPLFGLALLLRRRWRS